MTASQLPPGTTSDPVPRRTAALFAVLALCACLAAGALGAPAARAADVGAGPPTTASATGALARAVAIPAPATGAAATVAPVAPPGLQQRRNARSARRGACAPARGVLATRRSAMRTRKRLLCLMNRARARYGLPKLRANRCLQRVAGRHAHDMVHRRYFGHVTPNGYSPGARARLSGYVPRSSRWIVGENIAWGVAGAARPGWVVRAWMHSPGHRGNILSRRFRDAGIGIARGTPFGGFTRWRLRATFSVEFGAHGGHARCTRRR